MKSKNTKKIIGAAVGAVLVLAVVLAVVLSVTGGGGDKVSRELSVSEAQAIVDAKLESLAKVTASGAKKVLDKTSITVNEVEYGNEKDVILSCTYTSVDTRSALYENVNNVMANAYEYYLENEKSGKTTNATKVNIQVANSIASYIDLADEINGEITLYVYETDKGMSLYFSEEEVNICTGGLADVTKAIKDTNEVEYKGEKINIANKNTLRTGIIDCISLENVDAERPVDVNPIKAFIDDFKDEFYRNFIEADRWLYLVQGLGTTLAITGLAVCLGVVIGFVVAIVRCTNQMTGKLKIIDAVCRVYLTAIRGTPLMVQLLIIYFVLLLPLQIDKFVAAVLCFGLNSGAYVAEIVRGGIMSVDKGQIEAGRSLGFNYVQTMVNFVVPQAFKAILPALANEFITLLKESSVAFYIGVADLTQGGLKIRSITYSNFMPLIAVAIIYLILVMILTKLVGILERRLAKSDH